MPVQRCSNRQVSDARLFCTALGLCCQMQQEVLGWSVAMLMVFTMTCATHVDHMPCRLLCLPTVHGHEAGRTGHKASTHTNVPSTLCNPNFLSDSTTVVSQDLIRMPETCVLYAVWKKKHSSRHMQLSPTCMSAFSRRLRPTSLAMQTSRKLWRVSSLEELARSANRWQAPTGGSMS